MVHQSVFGLGDNATPVMAQTRASFEYTDANGMRQVRGQFTFPIAADVWATQIRPLINSGLMGYVKYDYPFSDDLWKTDIEPLLMQAGVQLAHVGHSHLWCRSKVRNMHYLETSNVGNSYGAFIAELTAKRDNVPTPAQTQALTSFT